MKILLIDDDQFFRKFYTEKLTEVGYQIDTASDGEEGIQKIASFQPNLILLDIIMPKKNGFEVLQLLSANETTKNIPVIVFSTLGNEQDTQKAAQLGATDFVNKTFFDFDTLLEKIKKALPTT